MSSIKVLKKHSDENHVARLQIEVNSIRRELADWRRRWNGFINPIEASLAEIEKRLAKAIAAEE